MSRAFGDFVLKNNGIICIPEVSHHRITPQDEFLVVATDGVSKLLKKKKSLLELIMNFRKDWFNYSKYLILLIEGVGCAEQRGSSVDGSGCR